MVTRRYDRARIPPKGLEGGADGRASKFVIRADSPDEEETPASGRFALKAGEKFLLECAGGGGFGDPGRRDRRAVARDIDEGYVSPASAARDYGYDTGAT